MFPTSRIKKIIKADKDLDMMTSEAVFMVGVATV
jgi:DNA polymerase epsilon subunit 4